MATKLQEFDFGPQSRLTNGDKAVYPWDDWFDGDIWSIRMGEDFEGTPLMMERIIRSRAVSREAKVTLRHQSTDGGPGMGVIVFQRTDIEGPEAKQRRLDAAAAKRQERAAKKASVEPSKAKDKPAAKATARSPRRSHRRSAGSPRCPRSLAPPLSGVMGVEANEVKGTRVRHGARVLSRLSTALFTPCVERKRFSTHSPQALATRSTAESRARSTDP